MVATASRVAGAEKFDMEPVIDAVDGLTADHEGIEREVEDAPEGSWTEKWAGAELESEDEEEPSIPGIT